MRCVAVFRFTRDAVRAFLLAMKIPSLAELPEVGQGSEWARRLHAPPSTITRAFQNGKLRGSKIGRRTVLFTREDIFAWLGLEVRPEPAPAAPAPQPIGRMFAKTPTAVSKPQRRRAVAAK